MSEGLETHEQGAAGDPRFFHEVKTGRKTTARFPRLLRTAEVAEILDIPPPVARNWMIKGTLPHIRLPGEGDYRVAAHALAEVPLGQPDHVERIIACLERQDVSK